MGRRRRNITWRSTNEIEKKLCKERWHSGGKLDHNQQWPGAVETETWPRLSSCFKHAQPLHWNVTASREADPWTLGVRMVLKASLASSTLFQSKMPAKLETGRPVDSGDRRCLGEACSTKSKTNRCQTTCNFDRRNSGFP